MLTISLSFLISIIFWIWIIMKYDKFERESVISILLIFVTGGLISSLAAGFLNDVFLFVLNHSISTLPNGSTGGDQTILFFGFVGINEEFFKAAVTILLIRKMKGFNEPADALVYSMTVAFGFSAFENIIYSLQYGFAAFIIRQFNAVPLHIGLAAIWGIGIAKAKFLRQGRYLNAAWPYIIIAAVIHSGYNISASIIGSPVISFILLSVFAFFLIRFAIRKMKHYSLDGPFANRLFCHSCNTLNQPDEPFCTNCGKEFELEFYDLCAVCNVKISKALAACPNCGAEKRGGDGHSRQPKDNF